MGYFDMEFMKRKAKERVHRKDIQKESTKLSNRKWSDSDDNDNQSDLVLLQTVTPKKWANKGKCN